MNFSKTDELKRPYFLIQFKNTAKDHMSCMVMLKKTTGYLKILTRSFIGFFIF